jgi:hypothetical protein
MAIMAFNRALLTYRKSTSKIPHMWSASILVSKYGDFVCNTGYYQYGFKRRKKPMEYRKHLIQL